MSEIADQPLKPNRLNLPKRSIASIAEDAAHGPRRMVVVSDDLAEGGAIGCKGLGAHSAATGLLVEHLGPLGAAYSVQIGETHPGVAGLAVPTDLAIGRVAELASGQDQPTPPAFLVGRGAFQFPGATQGSVQRQPSPLAAEMGRTQTSSAVAPDLPSAIGYDANLHADQHSPCGYHLHGYSFGYRRAQ